MDKCALPHSTKTSNQICSRVIGGIGGVSLLAPLINKPHFQLVQDTLSPYEIIKVVFISCMVEAVEAYQWDGDVMHLRVVFAVVHRDFKIVGKAGDPTLLVAKLMLMDSESVSEMIYTYCCKSKEIFWIVRVFL